MKKRSIIFSLLLLIIVSSIAYLFIHLATPLENEKVTVKEVSHEKEVLALSPNIIEFPAEKNPVTKEIKPPISIADENSLIIKIDTTIESLGASGPTKFSLPVRKGEVDCTIAWGDGSIEKLTNSGLISHEYARPGEYKIAIVGKRFPGLRFEFKNDRLKLLEIYQWGNIEWQSMEKAFFGCENVRLTATDRPNWSAVYDFTFGFTNCYEIVSDFANYDISSGQKFKWCWAGCVGMKSFARMNFDNALTLERTWFLCSNLEKFGEISVPNCLSLRESWWKCSKLKEYPIIKNSAKVTDAAAAFVNLYKPRVFPLTDFSNVKDFQGTWYGNSALVTFNDPDTSKGTNFFGAFRNCYSLYKLKLNLNLMNNGKDCFRNCQLDIDVWNKILIDIDANNRNKNIVFHGGENLATGKGRIAYDRLKKRGWKIHEFDVKAKKNIPERNPLKDLDKDVDFFDGVL